MSKRNEQSNERTGKKRECHAAQMGINAECKHTREKVKNGTNLVQFQPGRTNLKSINYRGIPLAGICLDSTLSKILITKYHVRQTFRPMCRLIEVHHKSKPIFWSKLCHPFMRCRSIPLAQFSSLDLSQVEKWKSGNSIIGMAHIYRKIDQTQTRLENRLFVQNFIFLFFSQSHSRIGSFMISSMHTHTSPHMKILKISTEKKEKRKGVEEEKSNFYCQQIVENFIHQRILFSFDVQSSSRSEFVSPSI